jgi:hypothetical protein
MFVNLINNSNKYRVQCGEYQLSIVYGVDNYCGNDTVEIAAIHDRRLIIPAGMESFYNNDEVIGYQSEQQVKDFCSALCAVAGVEYTADMDAQITSIFASRL